MIITRKTSKFVVSILSGALAPTLILILFYFYHSALQLSALPAQSILWSYLIRGAMGGLVGGFIYTRWKSFLAVPTATFLMFFLVWIELKFIPGRLGPGGIAMVTGAFLGPWLARYLRPSIFVERASLLTLIYLVFCVLSFPYHHFDGKKWIASYAPVVEQKMQWVWNKIYAKASKQVDTWMLLPGGLNRKVLDTYRQKGKGPLLTRLDGEGNYDASFPVYSFYKKMGPFIKTSDDSALVSGRFPYALGTLLAEAPKMGATLVHLDESGVPNAEFSKNADRWLFGTISHMVQQSTGGIIVVYSPPTQWNKELGPKPDYPTLFRIDADGNFDDTFKVDASTVPYETNTLALTDLLIRKDDKILLVYGAPTHATADDSLQSTQALLVRLESNGALDQVFQKNIGLGSNGPIKTAHLLENGEMLIAGSFHKWNRTRVRCLVRLKGNGKLDPHFKLSPPLPDDRASYQSRFQVKETNQERTVASQIPCPTNNRFANPSGGNTLWHYSIQVAAGKSHPIYEPGLHLTRLSERGKVDVDFSRTMERLFKGCSGKFGDLKAMDEKKIMIAGYFSHCPQLAKANVLHLDQTGFLEEAFTIPVHPQMGWIDRFWIQPNGSVWVAGKAR